jgi:hypothetical protein
MITFQLNLSSLVVLYEMIVDGRMKTNIFCVSYIRRQAGIAQSV